MEAKYQYNDRHVIDLEHRLKSLDSEYCANEVMRDNLKSDRIKYLSFLERMGKVLKVSEVSADIGLDMNVDLILARADQLVRMEGDSLADKQTNIYNLQRKVKQMKEQVGNILMGRRNYFCLLNINIIFCKCIFILSFLFFPINFTG